MILQGNQRGGARDLALHLLKDENDHVEVHEVRGFVSDDLPSAFNEAYAISRGTRAKQFLYSLSLNPPLGENVSTRDFESAIERAEERLGLSGQPRAIVFHEKRQGIGTHKEDTRRHCHVVWSRIDTQQMKAIPLPFTKYKLQELSRELYIEHGWKMPQGFQHSQNRAPQNFTLAEWQQAKRQGKDPRQIKSAIQDSWAVSDTQTSFQRALKERGFTLAKGDRRSVVALDQACEVYAVSKWLGHRAKQVRERLSDQDSLPSVDQARTAIAKEMAERLTFLKSQREKSAQSRLSQIEERRSALITQQQEARAQLKAEQEQRWMSEAQQRQARYSKGLRGFFDRLTGKSKRIKVQNEHETQLATERDQKERDALVLRQTEQRQSLDTRKSLVETAKERRQEALSQDIVQYHEIRDRKRVLFELRERMKTRSSTPDHKPEI
ncbi:MAG: relaxase/mobilization nuclease domain-containing protein [Neptuniibacter sp.]